MSCFKVQGNFLLLCSSSNFVGYSYNLFLYTHQVKHEATSDIMYINKTPELKHTLPAACVATLHRPAKQPLDHCAGPPQIKGDFVDLFGNLQHVEIYPVDGKKPLIIEWLEYDALRILQHFFNQAARAASMDIEM